MDLGRFLVEAVVVSGASPTELARSHPISRSWLFRLLARYKAGGYEALEPRSRRPKSCPSRTAPEIQQAIVDLRRELTVSGLDAGPQTIAHHLKLRFGTAPSRPTIWRILKSKGLIEPQPHKRPKSSWIRFQAELPNEMWQADATHWQLADATDVEILNLIDDHSRFSLASVAFRTVKAPDVLHTFYAAAESYGYPAKFLSDNAAVFSGAPRRGRVVLESELDRLGIESKHSSPYHPQTVPPCKRRVIRTGCNNPSTACRSRSPKLRAAWPWKRKVRVGAALTTTGRTGTTRRTGLGKQDGKVYESRNQRWNPLKGEPSSNLVDMGWATVRVDLRAGDGDLRFLWIWQDKGHGECLRRNRGEAVGEKLDTVPVNRHTLNMGTISAPPSPPLCQSGDGQARCRLMTPRWDGGSVVVRGWESQPHGEGTQQDRSAVSGMPGGRR